MRTWLEIWTMQSCYSSWTLALLIFFIGISNKSVPKKIIYNALNYFFLQMCGSFVPLSKNRVKRSNSSIWPFKQFRHNSYWSTWKDHSAMYSIITGLRTAYKPWDGSMQVCGRWGSDNTPARPGGNTHCAHLRCRPASLCDNLAFSEFMLFRRQNSCLTDKCVSASFYCCLICHLLKNPMGLKKDRLTTTSSLLRVGSFLH